METLGSNVPGLDSLLNGGFINGRMYLIRGEPGVGKSLLGAHFLKGGLDNGETVLYIHGEESRADIVANLRELGIDLSDAEFLDLGPDTDFFTEGTSYEVVDPADLEAEQITTDIQEIIDDLDPTRVFLDPITQLEYIETDEYQYRKRLLSLLRFLRERDMTVLATKTTSPSGDPVFESGNNAASISDGILDLYRHEGGRRISVPKHRGIGQSDRTHGLEIRGGGLEVYPQIVPDLGDTVFDPRSISSGNEPLDSLLGGGIEAGTITFLNGPAGVGKSTLAMQFLTALCQNSMNAGIYLFEESVDQFLYRGKALGYPLEELHSEDRISLTEIEPLALSAEEFGRLVTTDVAENELDAVLIDGINGYQVSLQGNKQRLVRRLHGLTRSLKRDGVTVFVTNELTQMVGLESVTEMHASYIADNILYLTYLTEEGRLNRAIGVVKKRLGAFDSRFYHYTLESGNGIVVGSPVDDMEAVKN